MHQNAELIEQFYKSFQNKDAEAMAACYHPNVEFSDEVFPDLKGKRAGDMWRMLCARGADLKVEFRDVVADDTKGTAHWDAWYTFSSTGNKVHNSIDATFEFVDGKIHRHRDKFNFYNWASQALGTAGKLLGWTPIIRKKVQAEAAKNLDQFVSKT